MRSLIVSLMMLAAAEVVASDAGAGPGPAVIVDHGPAEADPEKASPGYAGYRAPQVSRPPDPGQGLCPDGREAPCDGPPVPVSAREIDGLHRLAVLCEAQMRTTACDTVHRQLKALYGSDAAAAAAVRDWRAGR